MASALWKWLHMTGGKSEKRNAAIKNPENGGSPRRRHRIGRTAAHAARGLLARARNAMSRVSPAAENNNNNNNGGVSTSSSNGGVAVGVSGGIGGRPRTNNKSVASKQHQSASATAAAHVKLVRTRRLMREFQEMNARQMNPTSQSTPPVFTVELVDDNLYEWQVKLNRVDPDSELSRDLRETNTPFVLLSLSFPDNFPFAPPFMRVLSPRIERGFVMEGGAICMELLTPTGWASAYTVEAIVMQFAASVVKGQGRIVRKVKVKGGGGGAMAMAGTSKAAKAAAAAVGSSAGKIFTRKAAEASFRSLVKTHDKYGWVTPPLSDG